MPALISTPLKPTSSLVLPTTTTPTLTPSTVPQKRLNVPDESHNIEEHRQAAIDHDQNARLVDIRLSRTQATAGDAGPTPQPNEPPPQNSSVTPGRVTNIPIPIINTITPPNQVTSPAPKRRRIDVLDKESGSIHASTQTDIIEPPPSGARDCLVTNTCDNTVVESSATQPEPNPQPTKIRKPRLSAKSKGKQPTERVAVEVSTGIAAGPSSGVSRTRKSNKRTDKGRQQAIEDAAANIVAHAIEGSSSKKKTKRGRKAREVTPEGADTVKIVPSKVRMSDLCKNLRTGKKSTREKELEEIDKAEAARHGQQEVQGTPAAVDTTKNTSETAESRLERLSRAGEENARVVPNTVIIDGEIQIDETSLQLDRHANAAVERDAEQLEGIDESELTRRVNSSSWLKRDSGGPWSEESTERFFEALQMFGTDFGMISKLFPGRTRHSIKLKFRKEEKVNRQRVKQTLMGERILVDMEEYSRITNTVYEDPKYLERDLAEDRRRIEEEQAAAKEALEETARQREQEVEAERAAAEEESLAKENETGEAKGKRSGKSRRGKKTVKTKEN